MTFFPKQLIFLIIFFVIGVTGQTFAQNINGRLTTSDGTGIMGATLTVHLTSSDDLIGWGISGDGGAFDLTVPPTDTLVLRVRALGYRLLDTSLLLPLTNPLVLELSPGRNVLPETIVRTSRKPITENGDTTVVNFRSFRDSTDRKVAEVLSKIPGVEVAADGSIKVNGKSIDRILVEGSDLFGKDYQLASNNINAADIGRIEIIQHYESNPVLKQVSTSDNVVINLKLEDDVRAALAGSVLLGGGYGEEAKYQSYGALYRIARKDKSILIGSADNTASGNSFAGIKSNYAGGSGSKFIQPPVQLYGVPGFDQAALPAVFTDNGNRGFLTFRHESTLSPRWRLNVNGVIDGERSNAVIQTTETFLGDTSSFQRSASEDWSLRRRYGEGQLKLNYLAADQRSSFDLAATGAASLHQIHQDYTVDSDTFRLSPRLTMNNLSFNTEYVRAVKQHTVFRFRAYHGHSRQPTQVAFNDYPALSTALEREDVQADFSLAAKLTGAGARILHRRGLLTQSLSYDLLQSDYAESGTQARTHYLGTVSRYQLSGKALLTARGRIGQQQYLRPDNLSGITYQGSLLLENKFSRDRDLRLSLATGRYFPGAEQQLTRLGAISGGFSINLPAPTPELIESRSANIYFGKTDKVKLTNFSAGFSFNEQRNAPTFGGFFQDNIIFNQTVYGVNRRSFILNTSYSWFITSLKSNLKVSHTGAVSESALRLDEELIAINFFSNTLTIEGTVLLNPRVRLISRIAHRRQSQLETKQTFTTTNAMAKVFYQTGGARLYIAYNYIRINDGRNGRFSDGTYFGADKKVRIRDYDLLFKVNVFNVFNRATYESQRLGESFIYTSTVNALPRFAQIAIDFTL